MKKLKLKLQRPIVFFDLETTGLKPTDKIVSISVFKVSPDGSTEGKSMFINPEMPIPKVASDVHGITDDMVIDKPTFKKVSKGILLFIENCDIAGFNNNNFDNIILCEEFSRCEINFPEADVRSIDVCTIFKKMEERTLSGAYKFYCGKVLEDAHSSDADTLATYEVFVEQLEKYDVLKGKSVEELSDFCKLDNRVDLAGKIIKNDNGDYLYNFGKHKDQRIIDNPSYAEWMLAGDFSGNTKSIVKKVLIDANLKKEGF